MRWVVAVQVVADWFALGLVGWPPTKVGFSLVHEFAAAAVVVVAG